MRPGRLLSGSLLFAALAAGLTAADAPSRRELIIVVDGLRPDYVTPAAMPRLSRLGQRGIVFNAHHSVVPTVTRVNGASLVTGAYPETHGLLGNAIYIPSVSPTRVLDTGAREDLEAVERADGHLLTAPTLGELLEHAGKSFLAIGTGTTGSAYVLNQAAAKRTIIHSDYTLPPELGGRVLQRLGPVPPRAMPNAAHHRRAVDAYLSFGVDDLRADVTILWFNDPDVTAHAKGIGSAAARESLTVVDTQIGRIEDELRAKGLLERTNVIVTTDHGFSTHTGGLRLEAFVAPFAEPLPDGSSDIVVAEGAIYFRGRADASRTARVVAALQQRREVGAIFTRPGRGKGSEGTVPGTLSYEVARWNHPRAGEILVSPAWTADVNEAGYPGTTTQSGAAGHGASSPYDVHTMMIAAGPDFREHAVSEVPTSNADLAPTVLRLAGLPIPKSITGRVIEEGLRKGPAPSSLRVEHVNEVVRTPDGSYTLTAHLSVAAGHRYLDFTDVVRR
jgi:arylsulfatase A-like enzyme